MTPINPFVWILTVSLFQMPCPPASARMAGIPEWDAEWMAIPGVSLLTIRSMPKLSDIERSAVHFEFPEGINTKGPTLHSYLHHEVYVIISFKDQFVKM
jgi:hypothetical protein